MTTIFKMIQRLSVRLPLIVGVLLALPLLNRVSLGAERDGLWLVFDIGLGNAAEYYGDAVGIDFEAQVLDGDVVHSVFRKVWRKAAWYPVAVDLTPWAGKQVTLRLTTRPWYDRMGHDFSYLGDPRVVVGDVLSSDPADRKTILRLYDMPGYQGKTSPPVPGAFREGFWAMPTVVDGQTVCRFDIPVKLPEVKGLAQPVVRMPESDELPWSKALPPRASEFESRSVGIDFAILDIKTETFPLNPNEVAVFDREQLTFKVGIGSEDALRFGENREGQGYACAGFEAVGLDKVKARISVTGRPQRLTPNSFLGLVVDYHTSAGYSKRVYLALNDEAAHPAARIFEGRAPLWDVNLEALSRRGTTLHQTQHRVMLGSRVGTSTVNLELNRWAPQDWDGGVWFGAVAIDQPASMEVKLLGVHEAAVVRSPRSIEQAETENFPILSNDTIAVTISPQTGAVAGVWDKRLNKRVIEKSDDLYQIERMEGISKSAERFDKVISIERDPQTITIQCENALFGDLLIKKVYRFGDSSQELSKQVTFTSRTDGGYFIELFSQIFLDPEFQKGGRFDFNPRTDQEDFMRVAGLGTRSEATFEHYGYNRVIAQYRYRINNRYVMAATDANFAPAGTYIPSGWRFPVFADYLDQATESSAEVRTLVLAGDEFDYYTYYDHLPEVEKVYDIEVSDWLWKECRLDAMRVTSYNLTHFRDIPSMTTRWSLNPLWGDYVSEGDIVIGGSVKPWPTRRAQDIAAQNLGIIQSLPNWRVSMYSWQWSIARSSKVISEHPEFVVTTRDGDFEFAGQGHDVTGEPAFRKQLRAPGCMDYFVDQYRRWAQKMNVQFIYIDSSPSGISRLDWRLKTVQQNYDWLEFFRRIRETLRSQVPDGFVFLNSNNSPYSDAGYYEDHRMGERIKEDWRSVAHKYMVIKYRERPKRWHALLYWNANTWPYYSNYTLGLGWTYSITDEGPEILKRISAYVGPAWELRGSRMVMGVESPRFWREDTDFEVHALRKANEGLVSVINHKDETSVVPVQLNAAKMGLDPARPVYVWHLRMRDPRRINEWAQASVKCFEKTYLGMRQIQDGKLTLKVEARPSLLELIVLTQSPLWFTDVNGEKLGTVQNNLLTASIKAKGSELGAFYVDVEKGSATLFLLKEGQNAPSILLDGQVCLSTPATLGNASGFTFQVPQGTHELSIK